MRMITRNLYNSAESTIWRIVMLNHHESLLIITIMMNPYTHTYIYIHSIPPKKDRRLFEVWILLFYPCFVQELLWYTHTHCYLQREAELVSKMEKLHGIYLHMSRFPTFSNCSTTFWELLYHSVDGQHPAPVNMVLEGKSMGRFCSQKVKALE